jgi:hypothetical protein
LITLVLATLTFIAFPAICIPLLVGYIKHIIGLGIMQAYLKLNPCDIGHMGRPQNFRSQIKNPHN